MHRITNVNHEAERGDCQRCGPEVKVRKSGVAKDGVPYWRCKHAYKKSQLAVSRPWVFFKGDMCELCSFIPEHSCQLTVDHIDGNKKNNEMENLQTLCHNCHALKTHTNNDYTNKYI